MYWPLRPKVCAAVEGAPNMSPTELMIRTIAWVCPCCGEVARTARQPRDCVTCGRNGSTFEQQREVALPSD